MIRQLINATFSHLRLLQQSMEQNLLLLSQLGHLKSADMHQQNVRSTALPLAMPYLSLTLSRIVQQLCNSFSDWRGQDDCSHALGARLVPPLVGCALCGSGKSQDDRSQQKQIKHVILSRSATVHLSSA